MPTHHLDDIDERDLSEAPRLAKDREPKGVMIGLSAAALLFIALLVYSSFPDLSPEEIVAMDGYEGEQPTKTIFNIHSFDNKDEKVATAAPTEEGNNLPPIAVTEPVERDQPAEATLADAAIVSSVQPEVVVAAFESTDVDAQETRAPTVTAVNEEGPTTLAIGPEVEAELPIMVAEPVIIEPVPSIEVEEPVSAQEQAESNPSRIITFGTDPEQKVVAAMATTPTIDEAADTVVVASVAAIEPVPVPVGVSENRDSSGSNRFLPLRTVLRDATALKATPSAQSKTLLTLRQGVMVTSFESAGEWVHIGTNDGSSITGYVLDSALGALDN